MDLYWSVIDSAHAALMRKGHVPPSPEHAADILHEKLVKKGLLEERYVSVMKKFYDLSKMITHREIQHITGKEYDVYLKEASDFVERMKKFIEEEK